MDGCQHYWILGSPEGDIVRGKCKRCEMDKIFPARLDDLDRGDDYRDLRESRPLHRAWTESLAS